MMWDKAGSKTRVMRFIWDLGDYYVEAAGCRTRAQRDSGMLKMSASMFRLKQQFAMSGIGEIRKSSHMSAVRPTVYTNPLPKCSFSKTIFFKAEDFKNTPALCLSVKGKHFENGAIENDDVTIITWIFLPKVFSGHRSKMTGAFYKFQPVLRICAIKVCKPWFGT